MPVLHRAHELWGNAFDFLPLHYMATRVHRAVRLDAVDDVPRWIVWPLWTYSWPDSRTLRTKVNA